MIDATVIIATRDRAGFLRDCLACLARQSAANRFDVVVVDNGSTDATRDVIASAALASNGAVRGVDVADPNRGKARNAGLAAATGRIIIFCDDDTLPPEGFVEAHLAAHSGGAVSGERVVSGPIINVADARSLPPPGPKNFSRAFFCTCNVSAPKSALQGIGGFDERYDLYGWEDTDVGVRLRDAGLRRIFVWAAYIYHVKPPESLALDRAMALAREKGAMAARFVRKSPTIAVKLATGAYTANFMRAAVVNAAPFRSLYARWASERPPASRLGRFAREALVDAAYIDSLRSAMRRRDDGRS
ncbi:MAG TPA: glycosyltransferase [Candidatus Eremiobacteraceae bacterium]